MGIQERLTNSEAVRAISLIKHANGLTSVNLISMEFGNINYQNLKFEILKS